MGLDMYLEVETVASGYEFTPEEERTRYQAILEASGLKRFVENGNARPLSITASVGVAYWRKANQVHWWFVKHCQDGRDECQRTYVPREALVKLVETARLAIAAYDKGDLKRCAELIPTQEGFFFGDTAYDGWYREDLKYTVERLEQVLKDTDGQLLSFFYQSSW